METILKRKVIHLSDSVSPSNDPWFDDERNIKMVQEGIEQLKAGGGKIYTAAELKSRFGL